MGGLNHNSTNRKVDTRSLNLVPVYKESDFGTFASDEVALVAGNNYEMRAPITLSSGGWRLPTDGSVRISSTNWISNFLTYTNANKPLFNGTNTGDIQIDNCRLFFDSATQNVCDLDGNLSLSATFSLDFSVIRAIAAAGWGNFQQYLTVIFRSSVTNMGDEILFTDCPVFFMFASAVINNSDSSNALLAFESTFPTVTEIVSSQILPFPNESALRISSATQDADSRFTIKDCNTLTSTFSGNLFDPSGLDENDPRIKSRDNFERANSTTVLAARFKPIAPVITDLPAAGATVLVNAVGEWSTDKASRISIDTCGVATVSSKEPVILAFDGNVNCEPASSTKQITMQYFSWLTADVVVTFDNTTNIILETGTPRIAGDRVIFYDTAGTLPAELREDTVYFVVNVNANDFQVSYTSADTPVPFTDDGSGTNSYSVATLISSQPSLPIASNNPRDSIPQGLALLNENDKFGIFMTNEDDAVDVTAKSGYNRAVRVS